MGATSPTQGHAVRSKPAAPGRAAPRFGLRHKLVLAGVAFALACVVIEAAAMALLWSTPESNRPFLIDPGALRGRREPEPDLIGRRAGGAVAAPVTLSFVDPHLGYAHDPTVLPEFGRFPGFAVYGSEADGAPRIVALGGSTTDAFCLDRNWPRQLAEGLEASGVPHRVLNGGVGGYSSNQELLKLIRDGLPLEPRAALSLTGINDVGFIHSVPRHPMVNPYQRRVLGHLVRSARRESVLFPNTLALLGTRGRRSVNGLSMGSRTEEEPVEQWMRNVRLMHAASNELGVRYVAFLQPTMGVGLYQPTPDESALLAEAGDGYRDALEAFYDVARSFAAETPYVVDLTDLFEGRTGLYSDPRHPNAEGNALIATRVQQELDLRGILREPTEP